MTILSPSPAVTRKNDDWPRPFCFGHLIGRVLGIMYIIQLRVDEMESN